VVDQQPALGLRLVKGVVIRGCFLAIVIRRLVK